MWGLWWAPLIVIMIANGIARESLYGPGMSELRAHQLSTLTGAALYFAYVWIVFDRLGISDPAMAWAIGAAWLAFTVAFEFSFGHFVAGHPWSRLLEDYDLSQGRVWSLFLVWVVVAPWVVYRLRDGG